MKRRKSDRTEKKFIAAQKQTLENLMIKILFTFTNILILSANGYAGELLNFFNNSTPLVTLDNLQSR